MKKWFLWGLCLLLTGCSQTKEIPPAASGSQPAVSIGEIVEETVWPSGDGRYEAVWQNGTLSVTDTVQTVEVLLPDGKTPLEGCPDRLSWQDRDGFDHRLYFTTPQGGYLFIPHRWEEVLSGDTFFCKAEALEQDYDFTQDGIGEEVSLITITDPNGVDVSWYELWVEQEGELLLREEFSTAHAGYNALLACRYEGKDCLLRYRPGFGMGYGYYGYQLFTLGPEGDTLREGSVEFDANFGHPNYQGPFDAAAIAGFLKEAYGLLEDATLLFSTEGGEVRRDMSGAEFFCAVDTLFALPEDMTEWEGHLENYAAEARYEVLLAATPVAEVGGEPVSPDGKYRLEAVGESDIYVSGLRPPEALRLVDEAGNILWEDQGWLEQEVHWSPDSRYAALYTAARTWGAIIVIDMENAKAVEVKLPGGGSFGEYVFLDEMRWVEVDTDRYALWFLLSDGERTDGYRYMPVSQMSFAQTTTILEGEYDFDRDGVKELLELDTIHDGTPLYYEIRVVEEGETIWMDDAYPAHTGWNSLFVYREEGKDYLFRYHPACFQGWCDYTYTIFSLDAHGEEVPQRENSVSFDTNWGLPDHSFDPKALAAFLEDVNSQLERSRLIVTTDMELEGIDPENPRHLWWENKLWGYTYDENLTLEANLTVMNDLLMEEYR